VFLLVCNLSGNAQSVPSSPEKPWQLDHEAQFAKQLKAIPDQTYTLDPNHIYSLAELVDLAESHNPETRVAWQNAKARAQILGVAESALFPTISAVALAGTSRNGTLYGSGWHRETVGLFQPSLNLNYLIFDFGQRSGAINEAKADLFAADFAFNDTHRKLIYQVTASYYRLLNSMGQEDAAKATLLNAQTVEKDAQSRLEHGLATLPDLLEAQAASAQADYDLQAAIGALQTAHGDLATSLGQPPGTPFQVQDISELPIPDALTDTADEAVDRALVQRPDLLEQVASVRSAEASIQQARSNFVPSLSFSGWGGLQRGYGQLDLLSGSYAGPSEAWNAEVSLQWTLFDGLKREHALAEAKARRAEALAKVNAMRDQISDEVWRAYSDAQTALRQKQAAAALLVSADKSYAAALKSYDLGVRNLLDVVAAQRTLAQARSADVFARTQVLTQISNLAFRTGDMVRNPSPRQSPQP
jgi:outer membrane protein